jgi:hypothetical protein
LVGTVLSDALSGPGKPMPTGPTIVLVATAVVLTSLAWRGLATVVRRRAAKGA